jgi:hypothetical protein
MKASLLCSAALLLLLLQSGEVNQVSQPRLWAGISAEQPLYTDDGRRNVVINFALVNDGDQAVLPEVEQSTLYINDEMIGPGHLFAPSEGVASLEPGAGTTYSIGLAHSTLNKPGVYKITWEGKSFKAGPIEVRILPRKSTPNQ